jgi:hypothetical protein
MDALVRLDDWRPRLDAYLRVVRGQPFVWGQLDCALFCAGAVAAMTGVDLACGWRGYRTEAAGLRKLVGAGFDTHVDLVASLLPEVHPSQVQIGDIVVLSGVTLALVQGRLALAIGPDGLGPVSMDTATRAFAV